MTNPDNVGGLPELPAPDFMLRWDSMRAAYYVSRPNVGNTDVYTADQMRAYGELCRAAPAGSGEVGELIDRLETEARLLVGCIGRSDQSSDVRALRDAAALLRKLSPAGSGEVDIAGAPKHWGDVMRELEAAAPYDLKDLVFEVSYACDQRLSFLALRVRELEALLRKPQQGAE